MLKLRSVCLNHFKLKKGYTRLIIIIVQGSDTEKILGNHEFPPLCKAGPALKSDHQVINDKITITLLFVAG